MCESIEKLHVSLFLLGIEIENQYLCLNKVIKKLKIEKKTDLCTRGYTEVIKKLKIKKDRKSVV